MRNLIKNLRTTLPAGEPFDSGQLHELGVSNALAAKYVSSGWLKRLDRGVFQFSGDALNFDRSLRFLERRVPGLHVAAKTALDRHGYRQNISFNEVTVVWAEGRVRLPEWFYAQFRIRFAVHELFELSLPFEQRVARLPDAPHGPLVSQPECAILEMLSEVGLSQEIEEARHIMEGLRRIRASRMRQAIASCRMVKAVRLCVYWAQELGLEWAESARSAVPEANRKGRWVGKLKDGKTLTLPPL